MPDFNQENQNNNSATSPGNSVNQVNPVSPTGPESTQQPNSQTTATPPNQTPTATNVQPLNPEPPKTPAKSSKLWIILLAIIVVIAIVGFAVFALLRPSSSSNNNTANSPATQDTTSSSSTTDSQGTIPNGWVTKTRKCFSFALPADNDLDDGDNSCLVSVRYGPDKVSGFTITYFLKPSGTAAENVAEWKKKNPTETVTSESSTSVGGLPATKLVYNPTSGYNTKNKRVTIFVETGDKYKIEGVNVNGFEITSRYDDQYDSKALFDQVLGTWKWL